MSPNTQARLHLWLTVAWFVAAIPICLLLSTSLPFLVFVSVYAVVTGHWAAWQAAKTEQKQDQMEVREEKREEEREERES